MEYLNQFTEWHKRLQAQASYKYIHIQTVPLSELNNVFC